MKQLFIALFCIPVVAAAQNCALKKETDRFSQEPRLSTGFLTFSAGGNPALLSIDADSREINLLFSLKTPGDAPCFDGESTAVVAYEGKSSKGTFRNNGAMNCNGIFQITFKNAPATPSALQRLSTQKVASITLTGGPKPIIISLNEEQQRMLSEKAACLVNEAKGLIRK